MLNLDTLVPPRIVVQAFFLGRLERLHAIRTGQNPDLEPWQNALLSRAIYSTYRDCLDLGLADEAQSLVDGDPSAPRSARLLTGY
jgi:hypothetical protein